MKPYYEQDGIVIYHGDARGVLPALAECVSATVTSPPYNTLGSRVPDNPTGMHAKNQWLSKVKTHGYADDMSEADYLNWQVETFELVRRVTSPGGSLFYNHKVRYRDLSPVHPIDLVRSFDGWSLRQEVVWDRCVAFAFNARMFAPSDERIYWLVKDGGGHAWNQEAASFLTIWRVPPFTGEDGHPCPYPEELPKRCIAAVTRAGEVVMDPFMGSGTTLRSQPSAWPKVPYRWRWARED